jgi:hypothetical protein
VSAEELGAVLESLRSARKFADPSSPHPLRLMSASGALPLAPTQISTVLFLLSRDAERDVRERATHSLAHLPERVLEPTLCGEVPGSLLAHLAELHRGDPERLQKIALNPHTPDSTFCFLASLPHASVVDVVSHNQTRLLRCPALVEILGDNPATSPATLDRVLEFLGIPRPNSSDPLEPPLPVPEPAPGTAEPHSEPFDPHSPEGFPTELLEEQELEPEGAESAHEKGAESAREKDWRSQSLIGRIQQMKIMQKVKLARFGNSEARSILVRDRNRLVCTAAIRSPKLNDTEVLSYCKSRSIPEEVLRIIAESREWTRNRAIKYALCIHPKTPVPSAMKFLKFLTDLELKNIMRSREVAAQISAHARRLLTKKGKL